MFYQSTASLNFRQQLCKLGFSKSQPSTLYTASPNPFLPHPKTLFSLSSSHQNKKIKK
ncbi:hypothetical protein BVRB_9g206410 [Beta vulgaris subsp. vulgaris]|uniref:Uncharacterized protein n=1 Tax=Beta vulgaris subsp. vulgaris TaxID=3555 RepID=A0A0J8BQN6_BETVV|nr:hypothetical protein BVRB_9g206410 [Beta vulgaris subsp. vulgaris]